MDWLDTGVISWRIKFPLIFWDKRAWCTMKTYCKFQKSKLPLQKGHLLMQPGFFCESVAMQALQRDYDIMVTNYIWHNIKHTSQQNWRNAKGVNTAISILKPHWKYVPVATFLQNDITLILARFVVLSKSNVQWVIVKASSDLSKTDECESFIMLVVMCVCVCVYHCSSENNVQWVALKG